MVSAMGKADKNVAEKAVSVGRCRKVMIMAGGTGGHVFPALAVAEALCSRGTQLCWLGTRRGIEAELVPDNNIPIRYIDVAGLRGKGIASLLSAPVKLIRALCQAISVLRKEKPSVVLGLGGFASGPGGLAARLLGIPLVIHEQNAVAGTTNKLLSRLAKRVLVAFPNALPRGVWTGNPVRADILELPAPEQRLSGLSGRSKRLLVLGGSLGATAINDTVPKALAKLPVELRPEVRHQCGKKHQPATEKAYGEAGVKANVEPFVADMAAAYGWADLVICRAGALTVAELAAAGVAAILVPFPHAIDDHQTHNAHWLVAQSAGVLLPQPQMTVEHLSELIKNWLSDEASLLEMAKHARGLAKLQVADTIADICEEVASGG